MEVTSKFRVGQVPAGSSRQRAAREKMEESGRLCRNEPRKSRCIVLIESNDINPVRHGRSNSMVIAALALGSKRRLRERAVTKAKTAGKSPAHISPLCFHFPPIPLLFELRWYVLRAMKREEEGDKELCDSTARAASLRVEHNQGRPRSKSPSLPPSLHTPPCRPRKASLSVVRLWIKDSQPASTAWTWDLSMVRAKLLLPLKPPDIRLPRR